MSRLDPSDRTPAVAMSIHALTASGVVLGLMGLVAVLDGDAKAAMLWLLAAQVVDGVDGPLARAYDVETTAPSVNGYILDLVVDYVTTVVIPVAFLYEFELLPPALSLPLSALIMFTAAIWFARNNLMTDDHWFNGFPATWNLVIPPLFLLNAPTWVTTFIVLTFCVLTLSSVKFVHPLQVGSDRPLTVAVTVLWLAAMTWMTIVYPSSPWWAEWTMLLAPVYLLGLSVRRTWLQSEETPAVAEP